MTQGSDLDKYDADKVKSFVAVHGPMSVINALAEQVSDTADLFMLTKENRDTLEQSLVTDFQTTLSASLNKIF
jgi:hypothetical protein